MSETQDLLRRIDAWDDDSDPAPLLRWAAAHLRGCEDADITALREALHEAFDLIYTKVGVQWAADRGFDTAQWCDKTRPMVEGMHR